MTYPTITDAMVRNECRKLALGQFMSEVPDDAHNMSIYGAVEDGVAWQPFEHWRTEDIGELVEAHEERLFELAASLRPISKAILVYQAGIANVFKVRRFSAHHHEIREAERILQGTFRDCESFARGLAAAGVEVQTASCNKVGDITDAQWTWGLDECPFREDARSVNTANPSQGDTTNDAA